MKFLIKNILSCGFILIVFLFFLSHPAQTGDYAYIGLNIWFQNMIISLLPMMILINLLQKSGLYKPLMRPLCRLLYPVLHLPEEGIFVIFFGFLAGFPMGAKMTADLYEQKKVNGQMAEYLLAFTNNIGPAYFLGFVLTKICPGYAKAAALFLMYGIPLLYGILLRHTIYRHMPCKARTALKDSPSSFLSLIPECIQASLCQIAMLGGYMVFFNALRVIPHVLFSHHPALLILCHSLLEISGGLKCLQINLKSHPLYLLFVHAALSFGGLCCFFQTAALLPPGGHMTQKYMLHKIILCSITVLSCLILSLIHFI